MACLRGIRDAGDTQPLGSFLAQLHNNLDDPAGLGAFEIRFRTQVMEPHLDGPLDSLDRRFQNLGIIGAFHVLGSKALKEDDAVVTEDLKKLSKKFLQQQPETTLLQEWSSYKQHLLTGAFKDMDQVTTMEKLSSQNEE
ncbi:hypothetical protein PBY51_012563 [Eleginops maclovinus]|uniref:Uncharacterized protein n=1 Tax=Eleginops maclovinus TaxID=56733 RepID=A0AAN7Y6P1_ELEMC|nr:hypothetical protein PBY51_012563 [Eleginops maclovinus]